MPSRALLSYELRYVQRVRVTLSYRGTAPQVFALNTLVGDASTFEARVLVTESVAQALTRASSPGVWTCACCCRRERASAARTGARAALACCNALALSAARAN